MWYKVYSTRGLTNLNSEFFFNKTDCHTEVKEPSLPNYAPIAGDRIIGFIPFPSVVALSELQTASSRILTQVTVSIYYDDNHVYVKTAFEITQWQLLMSILMKNTK